MPKCHTAPSKAAIGPRPLGYRSALLALAVGIAISTIDTNAQPAQSARDLSRTFDIRNNKQAPEAAAYLERVHTRADAVADTGIKAQALAEAIADLRANRAIDTAMSPELGTLEVVSAKPGSAFLTGPSSDRVGSLRSFLSNHAAAFGLNEEQVNNFPLVANYENPSGTMAWVEFEQRINDIPVFRGYVRGGFTAKGELARTTGQLAAGLDAVSLSTRPAVNAADAVSRAAVHVGWDVPASALAEKEVEAGGRRVTFSGDAMSGDATAWQVYFPFATGVARLAWATQIWGDPDAFLIVLDAEDGTVLFRKNLTDHQALAVTFSIYNDDSPAPASPSIATPDNHLQAASITRTTHVLIGNEAPYTFNNLGWIPDGGNTTAGNNVIAGVDLGPPDGVDAPVTGSSFRGFNFVYDPAVDSPASANYRRGEVTNMFYWTNRFHDFTYQLGFTEAARNFQQDNFGRGGLGMDRVSAETQDYSSTENADFTTGVDGSTGRMQMYLWPGPTPDRSGGLDRDVVLHELTHGMSNRLHANAAGLATNMSAGLGEGWSDFYARSLAATADENTSGVYTIGGWLTNLAVSSYTDNYYYGIRRFPYALITSTGGPLNRPFNPLTFADTDSNDFNVSDGAYPRGPFGSVTVDQVHNLGEIWASALFEVRARFIARHGFATGNQRILQFVTDGMKLDPASPSFLQARDSIIAAANAAGASAEEIGDIWAGFATRGMGVFASIQNAGTGANNTRVTENFNVPGDPPSPTSADDAFTALINTPLNIAAPGVLANDNTNGGGAMSAVLDSAPSSGAVTLNANGGFSYSPASGFIGPATFTYHALNVNGPGNVATVTISVNAPLAPTSNADSYATAFETPLAIAAPGVLANDNSNGGGAMTATIVSGPSSGVLSLNANGSFNFTPASGFVGAATFTYRASNLGGPGNVSPVTITVNPPAPPTSSADSYTTAFNTALNIAAPGVLANDNSNGGGAMTATIVSGPSSGVLSLNANGSFNFTPATAFFGAATFTYRASNTGGLGNVATVTINVAEATAPQPPTNLLAYSVVGNLVTLRWTPATTGPSATGFVIEGGINPGQVLGSLPTGSAYPIFTFSAPTGAFYVRVHQLSGADRSPPSNEIRLYVNVPALPSPPANLLALVNGTSLHLAWRNTFEGGAPASLLIDVTGPVTGSLPVGLTDQLQFNGVPPGSYTIALRAANAGSVSAASNSVVVSVPAACAGPPPPPVNFLFYKAGGTAFAVWDPPPTGPAPSGYVLNVSGPITLSLPLGARSISAVPPPGTYGVSVAATNACGSSTPTAVQTIVIP